MSFRVNDGFGNQPEYRRPDIKTGLPPGNRKHLKVMVEVNISSITK